MPARPKYTETQVAEAITQADGNLTVAAKSLHCTPYTVRRYVNKSPKLEEIVEEARAVFVDFAEHKLREHIENGNLTATIFFLKTQGRHLGYIERPEPGSEYDDTETIVTMEMGKTLRLPSKVKALQTDETTH
jgi:hypothetical protein